MGCKCINNQTDPQYCNDVNVEQISLGCQGDLNKNNLNKNFSSQSLSIKSDLLGNGGIQVDEMPSTTTHNNILRQKSNPFRLKDYTSDLSSKNETFNRMNSKIDPSTKHIHIRTTVSAFIYVNMTYIQSRNFMTC